MPEKTPKPNPVDQARERVEKAISEESFNGAKVLLELDRFQIASLEVGIPPLDMYTELVTHASSARDRMTKAEQVMQAGIFSRRVDIYVSTAELLIAQKDIQPATMDFKPVVEESIAKPTRTSRTPNVPRIAAARVSQPTRTASLPSTNSPKR